LSGRERLLSGNGQRGALRGRGSVKSHLEVCIIIADIAASAVPTG
jgi:hypothetical protein